ncbi:hypothetical protein NDU88_006607 [Pleurodeles waltl]|uniref:Uncharacterized protein n=1 Tax=Pleurodeles waltl TaxID=8319 RepID=A0AAV7N1B8_PLEWA|nr:hypothetical protein NDU88_006607 [Pleurodeles waltl]
MKEESFPPVHRPARTGPETSTPSPPVLQRWGSRTAKRGQESSAPTPPLLFRRGSATAECRPPPRDNTQPFQPKVFFEEREHRCMPSRDSRRWLSQEPPNR